MRVRLNITETWKNVIYNVDSSSTILEVKKLIDNEYFIDANSFYIRNKSSRMLHNHEILDDICTNTQNDELDLEVCMRVVGGTLYKKSSSMMRWKWQKKRIRRLQRIRRKMRQRSR